MQNLLCRGREGKRNSKEGERESLKMHNVTSERSLDEDRDEEN